MGFRPSLVSKLRGRHALLAAAALALCGCAVVGPRSITAGRGSYAEVINATENEQILNVIVRQRYDETFGMLSVASVTASMRFRTEAATNLGIGPSDNYETNLVPLSAGVAYEENPTISYVPLSGEDFARRMLSPISTGEWILLARPTRHPGNVFSLAVTRVNGLRNPLPGRAPVSPSFTRLVELYDQLRRAAVLQNAQDTAGTGFNDRYFWVVHSYEGTYLEEVQEFLDLLGIAVKADGSDIRLPVLRAIGSSSSAVHLQLRSALDVLEVFGTGVDVPATHVDSGLVEVAQFPLSEAQRHITIRSAERRPENATVKIRFRDRWFYIDATDGRSKRAFIFIKRFINMRLADPTATTQPPVLTVPVN